MKNLIKKQEEELINEFRELVCKTYHCEEQEKCIETFEPFLKDFISKVRKETAEYVCDKMVASNHKRRFSEEKVEMFSYGYNTRLEEEEEIKQNILQEFK